MLLFLVVLLFVAVLLGVALARPRRRGMQADLGTISESWLAEQRAASYEIHR